MRALLCLFVILGTQVHASDEIQLQLGFITKIRCEGRLLISAIGNDQLVRLEAIPSSLGCGALLKPLAKAGITNLILETTTGTIRSKVVITASGDQSFEYRLKGDAE